MITITQEAASQLKSFLEDNGSPEAGLRVFVAPGGCSGLQYGMKLEAEKAEDDVVVEIDGITLLVDPYSAPMLDGVTVDFVDSLTGSGFKFENPNATAGCACGQSFSA